MESHGRGGSIQVTDATYELIKAEFACDPGGIRNVKGKGEMRVWFVLGPKDESPVV
jgi:guanylate cyclase